MDPSVFNAASSGSPSAGSNHPGLQVEAVAAQWPLDSNDGFSKNVGVFAWERWLLRSLLKAVGNPPFTVVLWNGEEVVP